MGWETLPAYDVSRILAIVDKNVAVLFDPSSFTLSEGNLTINETLVLVNLKSIDYITLGSHYYATLEIELVEVE